MYEKLNDFDVTLKTHTSIQIKYKSTLAQILKMNAFLGFDGYVDSLYSLVQSRENSSKWEKMENMKVFGERILQVAGSATSIERILKRKVSGGFAPNTCKAIHSLGMPVTLVAAIGHPEIHNAFIPLSAHKSIETLPISNPGETIGLEFNDGKIMLTDFENIFNIKWELLVKRIGVRVLADKIENSNIIGLGHWSLIPDLTDIWNQMLDIIFPSIRSEKKLFFADLSDIKKRSKSDIIEMVNTLNKIDEYIPVLLSLNDQEAIDISRALDGVVSIDPKLPSNAGYYEAGKNINTIANLSYLVIHSPHFATITTKDQEHYWVTEGYTSKPRFTTGAGDHFHSGVVVGLSCGLNPAESILLGNALTAIFVRTGNSPSLKELERFISDYLDYIKNDNPEFS